MHSLLAIDLEFMLSNRPAQCHLWQQSALTPSDLGPETFTTLTTYLDESHHMRKLLRCNTCGQLYFYAFTEEIDWAQGNDPQQRVYIPVRSIAEARRINRLPASGLSSLIPRLQVDWPADAAAPRARWIGRQP